MGFILQLASQTTAVCSCSPQGRKFCFVVMRFWILTAHGGPDDPEATKIFKVSSSPDNHPQTRIVTAVYE